MWNTAQESSDLLEATQRSHRATWKHMRYCSGIIRPIRSHANTTQSNMKIHEIPCRNRQTYQKPCKYHAEQHENTLNIFHESSELLKSCNDYVEPRENMWNTAQESSNPLEAMQIQRRATCKTFQILFRNLQTPAKPCECYAEPYENMSNTVTNLQTYWKPCK